MTSDLLWRGRSGHSGPLHRRENAYSAVVSMVMRVEMLWRGKNDGRLQASFSPQGFVSEFLTTPRFYSTSQFCWVCQRPQKIFFFLKPVSHRIWKNMKCLNWIGGVKKSFCSFPLCYFAASPFGVPNGFGENVVSPV